MVDFDVWLLEFSKKRETITICKPYYKCSNFEIWSARVPDKENNKGKSSAYRIVFFYDLAQMIIYKDFIEHRNKMGFKNEHPKQKQKYEKYLKKLKIYLEQTFS